MGGKGDGSLSSGGSPNADPTIMMAITGEPSVSVMGPGPATRANSSNVPGGSMARKDSNGMGNRANMKKSASGRVGAASSCPAIAEACGNTNVTGSSNNN